MFYHLTITLGNLSPHPDLSHRSLAYRPRWSHNQTDYPYRKPEQRYSTGKESAQRTYRADHERHLP
jgi:hypothetical protein